MLSRKPKLKTNNEEAPIVCSNDEQSNNTTCTRSNGDKNCQAEKSDTWPKKPKKDKRSNRPAMLIQHRMLKKQMPQEDDKNCQKNINMRPVMSKMCADKKCQAIKCYKKIDKNCQTNVVMWPVMPQCVLTRK